MNRLRYSWLCLVLFVVHFGVPAVCLGQSETGLPPLGSYSVQQIDSINLQTLNSHIHIPLFTKQARGYTASIEINGDTNACAGGYTCLYVSLQRQGKEPPPTGGLGWESTAYFCSDDPTYSTYYYYQDNYSMVDNNTTTHNFPGSLYDYSECDYGGGVEIQDSGGPANDNSGYTLTLDSYGNASVTTPGGLNGGANWAYDNNGNISSDSWISPNPETYEDSTGANITRSGYQGVNQVFTYTDSNGSPQTITANCTMKTIYAYWGSGLIINGGSQCLLTSVGLPDGTSYQFAYEVSPSNSSYTTGRPATITLPGGGTINYQYTGGLYGSGILSDVVIGEGTAELIRTTSDGATTYSRTQTLPPWCDPFSTPGCTYELVSTLVQDAQGNQTTVNSEMDGNFNLLETSRTSNYGPTITHDYYMGNGGSGFTLGGPWQTTSAPYGVQEFDVTTSGIGKTKTTYNSLSLPTEVDEYDWGYGSGGCCVQSTPSLKTLTSYATLGDIYDRPSEVQVTDGSGNTLQDTTYNYDEGTLTAAPSGLVNLRTVSGARGNLTSVHQRIGNGSSLTTNYAYDTAGALRSTTDPNGTTSYGYDSTDTFVASTTLPLTPSGVTLSSSATWDFNTGLMTSATDANGTLTQYHYNSYQRPSEIDVYDSSSTPIGKTTSTYTSNQISTHQYQSSGVYADTETLYDGYWRVSRTAVYNGQSSNPWYQQDTCYDSDGRLGFQSYAYQGTGFGMSKVCSVSGDSYTYDGFGRTTQVSHADGTSATTAYAGRATKTTDENNVKRIVQNDGLGRIIAVCEISSNSSMPGSGSPGSCSSDFDAPIGSGSNVGFLTTYGYSASGGALTTTATQGGQTRTFQTDWLGRPTMYQQPESGQTTYSYAYNSTGLQTILTRPQANQTNPSVTTTTTTQNDALGRSLSVVYSDGTPTNYFWYDLNSEWGSTLTNPKGRLVLAYSAAPAMTVYGYDALGNINLTLECTPSNCGTGSFGAAYHYDWLGNLTSADDGGLATTSYTYSPANEVQSITSSYSDSTHPPNLVSSVQNGPFGPLSWQLGNGLKGSRFYDTMGRTSGGYVCQGSVLSGCSGGTQYYGFTSGWTGAYLTSACDAILAQCSSYGYDEFGRLASKTVTAGVSGNYTYVYDRWGNRRQQNVTSGSGPQPQQSADTATNQINSSGYSYDAAGNLASDGIHTYTYDANGNMVQVDGGVETAVYDAFNRRVRVNVGGGASEYVFNAAGQRASTWNPATQSLVRGQAYWGGAPLEYYSGGAAHFQHQDWLGTERVRTTYAGSVEGTYSSLPFGDGYSSSGTDDDPYHFAGLDHEYASDTDGAQFRQYSNLAGRWMSPDPYGGSMDPTNPQSLNRYSYAMNNPLSNVDPSGLDCVTDNGPGDITIKPGDCPGIDPNDEIYIDATGVTDATISDDGDLVSYVTSDGQATIEAYASTSVLDPSNLLDGGGFQTTSTPASYIDDIGQWLLFPVQNRTTPLRLFGSHWCGFGGAGDPNSDVDRGCEAHDKCLDRAGINFGPNIGWGGWTKKQAAASKVCNQILYDYVKQYPNEPGSKLIQKWLLYGGWIGIRYPGTGVH